MARYRYKPLPTRQDADSIRLATIHPGIGADDVIVSLHTEPFTAHDPPGYEALSYTWGPRKFTKTIYIGKCDRMTLRVTRSLRAALQHLRYPHRKRVMWIDALCIDQSNDVEKGPQVAMMGQLFECASRVVVWLGPEENGSSVAMECLAFIGSQVDVDWGGMHRISPANTDGVDRTIADPNVELPLNREQSLAVAHLLSRSWFDRLWIRQEIFVSEDRAVVCCGPQQMPWPFFRKALRLFYSKRPKPHNAMSLMRERLTTIGGFVFQMRWTDILSMRGTFDNALCSDPRDRIYGIRALLYQHQQDLCGAPDYSKSAVDVFSDLTRGCITKYPNGLTILCQCELSVSSSWSGPSWVPDWSTKASYHWRHDTFASSQIRGWFRFPDAGILRVLGVSTTVVQEIRTIPKFYARDWNIGIDFLQSIASLSSQTTDYPSGGSLLRALSRTTVGGAVSDFLYVRDGNYPTTQMAEKVLLRVLSGEQLVEKDYNMGSDAQRFFKRMDWGSGEKSFIRCTGGYVGVAPPSTKIGDEIFVVAGCQQPLVLRKSIGGGPNRYSVVGGCYVEGCARAEPLLGKLPDHIGFSIIPSQTTPGWSRRFIDLSSGDVFSVDPRLHSLGLDPKLDLEHFKEQLIEDPNTMLSVEPELLMKRIKGLKKVDLV